MAFTFSGRTSISEECQRRTKTVNLLEYANENRHLGLFNDIEICVGNSCFHANRLILSCFSSYFEKMFKVDMKEKYQSSVEIKGIEENSMKNVIEFIYTGNVFINSDNVCDLLFASDYLQIEEVKEFCIKFLEAAVSFENCFTVLSIADRYQCSKLVACAMNIIVSSLDMVSTTIEFKQLSKDKLVDCFSYQMEDCVDEILKCNAILRWTKYDEESRADQLAHLLPLVDLNKVSHKFLVDVVMKEDLIMQNLDLCKFFLQHYSQLSSDKIQRENITRIVSIGGNGTSTSVVELYSFRNDTPRIYPCLPDGRTSGCSTVLFDFLYYVGGRNPICVDETVTKTAWRMNIRDKELKWENVESMMEPRFSAGAAVFNRSLVVVGGGDGKKSLTSGEMYTPATNTWKSISPMIQCRGGNAVVVCEGGLYSAGGFGDNMCLSSVECLLSCDGKWKKVKSMQSPRRWLTAVSLNGCIYAIGGYSNGQSLQTVEKYDPRKDEWNYVSDMNFQRRSSKACVLQERIFVFGGMNNKAEKIREVECYDPFFDQWNILGKTTYPLLNHSLVVL